MSGGALVDLNGDLIGINSHILSPSGGSIGLGFAIPSNMAKSVMTQLIKNGKVNRGMLGIGIQDVTSELAGSFNSKNIRGVIINSVSPNSPAEKAGLKQGDVILSFNGVNISNGNELRNRVAQTAPWTEVTVGISREGREQTVRTALGEFETKKEVAANENDNSKAESAQSKLGLSLELLTPQMARQLNLKNAPTNGLIVTDVQPGSPADEAGIEKGDVIVQINWRSKNGCGEGEREINFVVNQPRRTKFVCFGSNVEQFYLVFHKIPDELSLRFADKVHPE